MLWFRACLYFLFYLVMFILSGLCSPCPVQFLASVIPQSVHNVCHLRLPSLCRWKHLPFLSLLSVRHTLWWALFLLFPWDSCVLNFTVCLTPFEFGCIFWTLIWTLISSFACLSYVLCNESLESLCSTCHTWIYLFLALALAPSHEPCCSWSDRKTEIFFFVFSGFVPLSDHDNWDETPEVRRVRAQVWSDQSFCTWVWVTIVHVEVMCCFSCISILWPLKCNYIHLLNFKLNKHFILPLRIWYSVCHTGSTLIWLV